MATPTEVPWDDQSQCPLVLSRIQTLTRGTCWSGYCHNWELGKRGLWEPWVPDIMGRLLGDRHGLSVPDQRPRLCILCDGPVNFDVFMDYIFAVFAQVDVFVIVMQLASVCEEFFKTKPLKLALCFVG